MKKNIFAFGLFTLLFFLTAVSAQKRNSDTKTQVQTVSSVDLQRFAGKWYEVARYPNKFQRNCVGNMNMTYAVKADGKLAIVNQCMLKNGTIAKADGEAKITDTASKAKFKMDFPSKKAFFPAAWRNDYWIIDLDKDYQYAVAADPKGENLWILSRAPKMKDAVYQNILRRVEKLGYDPEKLIKTPQNLEAVKGEVIQKQ